MHKEIFNPVELIKILHLSLLGEHCIGSVKFIYILVHSARNYIPKNT